MMFAPGGSRSTFASGLDDPAGLAFNSAGDLFVSDQANGSIDEFTPGGTKSTFASGLSSPRGLAFNSAGDLIVSDEDSGNIFEFTPGGTQTTFASGLDGPTYLAFQGGTLPVPEPSAFGLLAVGVTALLVRRRKLLAA
jgi:DNA-binding beta-propeller fold protein YncE